MNIFRAVFRANNLRNKQAISQLYQFTSLDKMTTVRAKGSRPDEKEQVFHFGRAWQRHELALKSNEDLHKLWYVLLKEKNSILSDDMYVQRLYGENLPLTRIKRVEKSMKNLWKVMDFRKKVREDFQNHLLLQYTEKIQDEHQEQIERHQLEKKFEPDITPELLKRKARDLARDKNDTDYLQIYINLQNRKKQLKEHLKKKYDYKHNQIVDKDQLSEEQLKEIDPDKTIFKFTSSFMEQYHSGRRRISQEEVLRQHIKNWAELDLKTRRVVVNYLNARRARDAKKEFLRELSLLSQKIEYENKQEKEGRTKSLASEKEG